MKKTELYDKIYNDFGNKLVIIAKKVKEAKEDFDDLGRETFFNKEYKNLCNNFEKEFDAFLISKKMKNLFKNLDNKDVMIAIRDYNDIGKIFEDALYKLRNFKIKEGKVNKKFDFTSADFEAFYMGEKFKKFQEMLIKKMNKYHGSVIYDLLYNQ